MGKAAGGPVEDDLSDLEALLKEGDRLESFEGALYFVCNHSETGTWYPQSYYPECWSTEEWGEEDSDEPQPAVEQQEETPQLAAEWYEEEPQQAVEWQEGDTASRRAAGRRRLPARSG